ncbi:MAG TPA: hypothetical protein VJR23_16850 [Candidatus Acidoferrales bacterium]|nr:hypothetical protein [Candidatus Acidoferrales bacterium]
MNLGPYEYVVWIAGFLLEVGVVVCAVYRKTFLKYFSLNLYMVGTVIATCGLFVCLHEFGFTSKEYVYYYYYSDCLLYVLMYFVIIQFYQQVFEEMAVSKYIQSAAALLLAATALFSYLVVHQNKDHLTSRFVVELEQNLNFVGVVLTYVLWGSILKLRETRTRLIQLVLALGVYFSATAGIYALRNLFPELEPRFLHWLPPLVGIWLPLAWAYTFTRVSEDARLTPARLVVKPR